VYGAEMRPYSWIGPVPETEPHCYRTWYPPVFRASGSNLSSMVRITNPIHFKKVDELQASKGYTSHSYSASSPRRVTTRRASGCEYTPQQRVVLWQLRRLTTPMKVALLGQVRCVSDKVREPKLDTRSLEKSGERVKKQAKGTFNMPSTSKGGGGRSGERVMGFAALARYEPNKSALTCEGPQLGKFMSHAIAVLIRIRNVDFDTFNIIDLAKAMAQISYIAQKSSKDPGFLGRIDIKPILCNPTFLLYCFSLLKKTKTSGIDQVCTTGMTKRGILKLAKQLQDETYRPRPTKRVMIPKADKKRLRPLGISSTKDKVVQMALKIILEPIFEPIFNDHSHGFRPNRSCHSALKDIEFKWPNTVWLLEFDFRQAFDKLNHRVLRHQLAKRFRDEFAMKIIWRMLKTGYIMPFNLVDSKLELTEGTPQGSIISPLFANIYLNQLDDWVTGELIPKYSQNYNPKRRESDEYLRLTNHWKGSEWAPILEEVKKLSPHVPALYRRRTLEKIRSEEAKHTRIKYSEDEDKFRLTYSRFADDFLLGYMGSKESAKKILQEILFFCESELKMGINPSKTGIKHKKEGVMYLGYKIWLNSGEIPTKTGEIRKTRVRMMFTVPVEKLYKRYADRGFFQKVKANKTERYAGRRQDKWLFAPPYTIIMKYNAVTRGLLEYYGGSQRLSNLNKFIFDLRRSAALTLAHHFNQKTAKWAFEKYGRTLIVSTEAKDNSKSRTVEFYYPSLVATGKFRWKGSLNNINQLTREAVIGFPHPVSRSVVNAADELQCSIPNCTKQAKHWHHIKHKRKVGGTGIQRKIVLVDAMQIAVCQEHHNSIHRGKYDGPSLRKLKGYSPE
jgi:group II intron reverse transcriptase/maturase